MEAAAQFEYPLPILAIDTDKIVIETSELYEGSLLVKNAGGGTLSGRITSNVSGLTFSPDTFDTNETRVYYNFTLDLYKTGDIIHSNAVIMSNGGEKYIPIYIKILFPTLVTKEDAVLTDLNDFYDYALKYPAAARQLFVSRDFMIWLVNINYEFPEIFEQLINDPNKERALDNFFILSKLKSRASLAFFDKRLEVRLKPGEKSMYYGSFQLTRLGHGYIEASLHLKNDAPWLRLGRTEISGGDFGTADTLSVSYSVDPLQLKSRFASETVCIAGEGGLELPVAVKTYSPISFRLSKETFIFQDVGEVLVYNNTGVDATVELSCKDSYVKFKARRFFVGAYGQIPFDIKITALQHAQFVLKKQPCVNTEIYIRAVYGSSVVTRTLRVTVCEF